jgi:predicted acyltransferase
MAIVRLFISAFIVALIVIAATGWIWTGAHMPFDQMLWGRSALAVCVAAGLLGLAAIWKDRRIESQ